MLDETLIFKLWKTARLCFYSLVAELIMIVSHRTSGILDEFVGHNAVVSET